MIFNDELIPNLGFNLTSKLNICYNIIDENNEESDSDVKNKNDDDGYDLNNIIVQYGIISNILINKIKNCLTFEIFEYIPVERTEFCLMNAKRKVFSQSNQSILIDGSQIVNECRMIDFVDSHHNTLFVLHPFAGACFPLNYKGLL